MRICVYSGVMSTTASRRRALRSLLGQRVVCSQAELVDLLAGRGFVVTQATVSRDLQAIGAAKNGSDRYVLASQEGRSEGEAALARTLDEFADSITASGNVVVVRTPPGAAQVLAAAIDGGGLADVLGTVAGDDTVLVITREASGGGAVALLLEQIGANP